MTGYVTVLGGEAEFTEKKSRFIGSLAHVETETEARAFLAEIKKKQPEASHHVSCWILRENNTVRFSDDGEPSGTAGRPALEVLTRERVTDVCFVATRYFGGILLGAGGLTRAYANAAHIALAASGKAVMTPYVRVRVLFSYSDWSRCEAALREKAENVSAEYGAEVSALAELQPEALPALVSELGNRTAGRAKLSTELEFLKPVASET